MAGLGGLLKSIGLGIGYNMMYGQQYDLRQADLEQKRQQVESIKLQNEYTRTGMEMEAQRKRTLAGLMAGNAQQQAGEAETVNSPARQAQQYQQAANQLLASGDIDGASKLALLSQHSSAAARTASKALAEQKTTQAETLGRTAGDALDTVYDIIANRGQVNRSMMPPGILDRVQKAAQDYGIPPNQIPDFDSPQFLPWLKNLRNIGVSTTNQMKAEATAATATANRESRERMAKQMRASQWKIAQLRAQGQNEGKAPKSREMGMNTEIWDPEGKVKGERNSQDPRWVIAGVGKLTATQKTGISKLGLAAVELSRSLGDIAAMDMSARSGPFAELGVSTPFQALTKLGGNAMTPSQWQIMTVAAASVGNNIASLEAAYGGRLQTEKQQAHLREVTIPLPGDSGYTIAYKLANTKEIMISALKASPGGFWKTRQAQEMTADLNKSIPWDTRSVIALSNRDPKGKRSQAMIRALATKASQVKRTVDKGPLEINTSGVASPSGQQSTKNWQLPKGWSVNVR